MKWNMLVVSLVLGAGLCNQSFGIDLLSRMLGGKGSGCDTSCCDTAVAGPSCGSEGICGGGLLGNGPSCGSEGGLGGLCGNGPSCGTDGGCAAGAGCGAGAGIGGPSCGIDAGCAAAAGPSCGAEAAACRTPRKRPLLDLVRKVEARKKAMLAGLLKPSCDAGACDNGGAGLCGNGPSCGSEGGLGGLCGNGPSCGSEGGLGGLCGNGPSCGSDLSAGCTGIGGGCAAAAPSCGAENAAAGCDGNGLFSGKKHKGLLSRLFKKKASCDAAACDTCASIPTSGCSSCGSGTTTTAPAAPAIQAAPAPAAAPAPVVDPSAYLNSKRRVIQTSFVR